MYRHISLICKIASAEVFIEGSNDKVSILEIASFYRAMLSIRGTSHGPVSVSVCHKSEFYRNG